jgi:hypothetical protein
VNCELEDCEDVGTLGFLFSNEHKDGELVWSDWHVKFNRTIVSIDAPCTSEMAGLSIST